MRKAVRQRKQVGGGEDQQDRKELPLGGGTVHFHPSKHCQETCADHWTVWTQHAPLKTVSGGEEAPSLRIPFQVSGAPVSDSTS